MQAEYWELGLSKTITLMNFLPNRLGSTKAQEAQKRSQTTM
jgi:hypothetical protein